MTTAQHRATVRRSRPAAPPPRRRGVLSNIVLVLGELLLTLGVLVLAFVGWQVWMFDPSVARDQTSIADEYLQDWQSSEPSSNVPAAEDPTVEPDDAPVAATPSATADVWGVLYVPRFGKDWRRPIAWGTDMTQVLNRIGIGTYTQSTMPGAVGNTTLASHRAGMGSSFYDIEKFRLGDKIVLETKDGWYTYAYRNTQYIVDTDTNVLNPVPLVDDKAATSRVLTLQSCNPLPISNQERIMAFSVLESFTPRSAGAPDIVKKLGGS